MNRLGLLLGIGALVPYLPVLQWRWVDSDQYLQILMAQDVAAGRLREPFFWGQNYHFNFNQFLAAPLIFLGLDALHAVALVTWLALVVPLVFVVSRSSLYGWEFLCASPLVIAPDFVAAALARSGFLEPVALLALSIAFFAERPAWRLILFPLAGFCFRGHPQTAFLAVPLGISVLNRWSDRRAFWKTVGLGLPLLFAGAALHRGLEQFYLDHPERVLHPLQAVDWDVRNLWRYWDHKHHLNSLGVALLSGPMVLLGWRAWKEPRLLWTALLPLLWILLVVLAAGKARDQTPSVFFSGVRFFVALPVSALLCVYVDSRRAPQAAVPPSMGWRGLAWLVIATLVHLIWLWRFRPEERQFPSPVPFAAVGDTRGRCERFQGRGRRQLDHRDDILAYGCSYFSGDEVINGEYERRYWLRTLPKGSVLPAPVEAKTELQP